MGDQKFHKKCGASQKSSCHLSTSPNGLWNNEVHIGVVEEGFHFALGRKLRGRYLTRGDMGSQKIEKEHVDLHVVLLYHHRVKPKHRVAFYC